jgi:hypothetical protein
MNATKPLQSQQTAFYTSIRQNCFGMHDTILLMPISDTSPHIQAMQDHIITAMTGERRLLLALELSRVTHALAKQGIQDQHPDWPEEKVKREFWRLLFSSGTVPVGL